MSKIRILEKNTIPDEEMTGISQNYFEELLYSGKYEYYFERGQIITGTVLEFVKDGILIDVGAKSEAFLPSKEIADYEVSDPQSFLAPGSQYEFYVIRDEAGNAYDNRIILSYRKVSQARVWNNLEDNKITDEICEARIQEVVKGGVVVEVDGLRGFIPASHLRVKGGSNNPNLVGQTIPCMILEIDRQQNKLILSQKLAISKLYAGEREELMSSLVESLQQYEQEESENKDPKPVTVEGEIVRITDFGAFVKIGDTEMDGLLPLSEINWKKISHPGEELEIGQQVTVQVLNVVPEQSRISLSLKRLKPDPWNDIKDKVSIGSVLEGTVTKIANFGVFMNSEVDGIPLDSLGFDSLLLIGDIAGYENASHHNDVLNDFELNQKVKVAVKRIKQEDRRINFSTACFDEQGNVMMDRLIEPPPVVNNDNEEQIMDK